jgi:glycosyltransferase involved in cell wall biosynthesis
MSLDRPSAPTPGLAPASAPPLRVGILGQGFVDWGGGLDFLRMVCACLRASGQPVALHFLLPDLGPRAAAFRLALRLQAALARLRGRVTGRSYAPSSQLVLDAMAESGADLQVHHIDLGETALARAAQRLSLSALLPTMTPQSAGLGLPWVGYIYDFQHHHLPHLFSPQERQLRDRNFARMLDEARVVIVTSHAVAADARRFRPAARARIVVLPFSAAQLPKGFDTDGPAVQRRYGLDAPYFIICNQFWLHKDHRTAFEAFARVAARFGDVQLVCTGATADPRHPGHLEGLMQMAEARGVRDRIRVLGLVPKRDQLSLLSGALALVQPTLCEGGPGGLASNEAAALGVPMLLSDIAVNREVDEPGVRFFRAGDAQDLAQAMLERWQAGPRAPLDPADLSRRGQQRRAACGEALLRAIELARSEA